MEESFKQEHMHRQINFIKTILDNQNIPKMIKKDLDAKRRRGICKIIHFASLFGLNLFLEGRKKSRGHEECKSKFRDCEDNKKDLWRWKLSEQKILML